MNNSQLINQNELWKEIKGFPKYLASNKGDIKSFYRNKETILKGSYDHNGYRRVALWLNGKPHHYKVAKIIANTWLGDKPKGYVVAHDNGDHKNDAACNLIYKTQKDNIADKIVHGTMPLGENHHATKLTNIIARGIKFSEERTSVLSKLHGVSMSVICDIRKGRTWTHII